MFSYPQVIIKSVGPDWLTVTATSESSSEPLLRFANEVKEVYLGEGHISTKWAGLGYLGWKCGPLHCGARLENELIVILTGLSSLDWASEVPATEGKVTRFDLQVTVLLSDPVPNLAEVVYAKLSRENELRERKRTLKLIKSNTGQTVYVGHRRNAVMLRLYDKSPEIDGAKEGQYWRYEVEYKKKSAGRAYAKWLGHSNRPAYTASLVWKEFEKRGSAPLFNPETEVDAIAIGATASTLETKLSWLVRCVSPVVSQLCLLGHEEKVLKALKLKHLISMEQKYYGG